jgi:hypothetical protein
MITVCVRSLQLSRLIVELKWANGKATNQGFKEDRSQFPMDRILTWLGKGFRASTVPPPAVTTAAMSALEGVPGQSPDRKNSMPSNKGGAPCKWQNNHIRRNDHEFYEQSWVLGI